MVKLNFWEELAIDIIIAVGLLFLIRYLFDTSTWTLWIWVIALIVYWGLSSLIVKVIKGKDVIEKEEQERKKARSEISDWWKKQKGWEKWIIILGLLILIMIVIGAIFPNAFA